MAKSARFYGTGRRKKSVARVYLMPGKGEIVINKRPIDDYFGFETLKVIVRQPLVATDTVDKFDVLVNVRIYRPGRRHQTRYCKSASSGGRGFQTGS